MKMSTVYEHKVSICPVFRSPSTFDKLFTVPIISPYIMIMATTN
jgi:hypothetical protein